MQSIICSIALSVRNTLGISNTTNCYRYMRVNYGHTVLGRIQLTPKVKKIKTLRIQCNKRNIACLGGHQLKLTPLFNASVDNGFHRVVNSTVTPIYIIICIFQYHTL